MSDKGLLKFITCGSVDDGKSTLIGHILYDAKLLYADQEKALELESKVGSRGGDIDYSLLLDGLMAEREQGITIDVAYRYFTTDKRSFIVADTPGHEEYTRNMAVGASFADLAIILVDVNKGVMKQTKRHARICELMGIKHFIFAINKMDLADYKEEKFLQIKENIQELQNILGLRDIEIVPVSATEGDNVTKKSINMNWYKGGSILSILEEKGIFKEVEDEFYIPIQRVSRPSHEFRGFQGEVEAGEISLGDEVTILPTKEKAFIKSIIVTDREVDKGKKGDPITIQLNREVDVSRGYVITKNNKLKVEKNIYAKILSMDENSLSIGEEYYIKIGTKMTTATIDKIIYGIDINTGEKKETSIIEKNEIAYCKITLREKIVLSKFNDSKALGGLILINKVTNTTSACGVIDKIEEDNNSNNTVFISDKVKGRGEIFDDFIYNIDRMMIIKENKNDKTYQIGDNIPINGRSYNYPLDFDALILRDWIYLKIRNGKIYDINTIDYYNYTDYPVINGRGFKINIKSNNDLAEFLNEYKGSSNIEEKSFSERWLDFNYYRKVKFN